MQNTPPTVNYDNAMTVSVFGHVKITKFSVLQDTLLGDNIKHVTVGHYKDTVTNGSDIT